MSAPEKIWASHVEYFKKGREYYASGEWTDDECSKEVEYTRSDLIPALIAEAVAREREACAKLAYDMGAKYMRATYEIQYSRKRYDIEGVTRCVNTAANLISEDIAAAIRARGQG